MSVTFSGGITFTGGGFSFTAPPPSTPTAGWYAGGTPGTGGQTTVDRITFATDTATSTVRGPLSSAAYRRAGATGTLNYGWFGGGAFGTDNTGHSTVQRITYTTDTATASVRGPLSYSALNLAAAGTDTYGWFGGGYQPSPPVGPVSFSTVSRITYATDTATSTGRGPLSLSFYGEAASTDSTTYAWFGGGYSTPSNVTRITYANDTVTSTAKGPLSVGRSRMGATGTTSYGWFGGGGALSTVDRIDYANDTATASVRGPLSLGRFGLAASTDTTYGWFGGGYATPGYRSIVDRITYATDTATATARGPLSRSVGAFSATSGLQ